MWNGTNFSPLGKIWFRNAHWTRRLGVKDRMRLLSPPSVLPAPREDQRCGQHNATSIQAGTMSMCRGMHCGATCRPGPGTHHTSPTNVSIDRELPHRMSCRRCFVPSTARQHIWCGDATHRKVRHICPRRLLTRNHPYPAQVADTCAPLGNPILTPPAKMRQEPRTALQFRMMLKRINLAHKVDKSEITSHMTHSLRQQTSLSPMDTSVSLAPSDTSDPSSTIASAMMMTSRHELHQLWQ
jgi:hypothetical protein